MRRSTPTRKTTCLILRSLRGSSPCREKESKPKFSDGKTEERTGAQIRRDEESGAEEKAGSRDRGTAKDRRGTEEKRGD